MKTRESRYVKVVRIAYHLTQQALPRYSHPKSPHHFTLPQLATCVLLMFYLDFSYRDMEEWLLATDQVCQALELPRIPDHTTLQRTYKKLRMLDFEKMKNQLLDENSVDEEGIASDSTGFSPGQASLYYQTRTGRLYQRWAKGVYAVGTASQFILAWRSGWGPGSDVAFLPGLRRDSRRYGHYRGKDKAWVMMADAGLINSKESRKKAEFPLLHMLFNGNPGTGKTTVARLIGELFFECGILKKGHLVEVTSSDLVSDHVGGTAIKTTSVIQSAYDGVLFIDEAYTLTEEGRGKFGNEAIDTILSFLENQRDRLVVIFAGYSKQMDQFMNSNPGLSRRIPQENRFLFPDYTPEELWNILELELRRRSLPFDLEMQDLLKSALEELHKNRSETFGNAGEVRNMVDGVAHGVADVVTKLRPLAANFTLGHC